MQIRTRIKDTTVFKALKYVVSIKVSLLVLEIILIIHNYRIVSHILGTRQVSCCTYSLTHICLYI